MTVLGATNVNEFSCVSEKTIYDHEVLLIPGNAGKSVKFGNAVLKVKTTSLDCGNEVMNENLSSMMNAGKYPFIVVNLIEVNAEDGKIIRLQPGTNLIAKTYITLAGVRKMNMIKLAAVTNVDGSLTFRGQHRLSLGSYGLEPPTAFFGLVQVADEITVQFDLRLKAQEKLLQ